MPSSFSCSRIKQYLAEKDNFPLFILLALNYFFGIILSGSGSEELYKANTFAIHQCQVKSIDFKFINRNLRPRWNITVVHHNQTINDSLLAPKGFTLESEAWDAAQKYKVIFEILLLKHNQIFFYNTFLSSSLDKSNISMLSFSKSNINQSVDLAVE